MLDNGRYSVFSKSMPAASKMGGLLLVDDADNDRMLFKIAFAESGVKELRLLTPLINGAEAIDYLAGTGKFHDRAIYPYPDLLVLDLKMPLKTGFQVMEWLQSQGSAPAVVILSDSTAAVDKERAKSLGALEYCVKPTGLLELAALIRKFETIYRKSKSRRRFHSQSARVASPALSERRFS